MYSVSHLLLSVLQQLVAHSFAYIWPSAVEPITQRVHGLRVCRCIWIQLRTSEWCAAHKGSGWCRLSMRRRRSQNDNVAPHNRTRIEREIWWITSFELWHIRAKMKWTKMCRVKRTQEMRTRQRTRRNSIYSNVNFGFFIFRRWLISFVSI